MRRSGFTLIELLIVVAIIAILAAIAVPNFLEAQVRSKVSRAKADLRSMATAVEAYTVDYNSAFSDANHRDGAWATCNNSHNNPWNVTCETGAPIDAKIGSSSTPDTADHHHLRWAIRTYTNWIPLTSPTAYVTSVPNDPFTSGMPIAYETPRFDSSGKTAFAVMYAMGPDKACDDSQHFPEYVYDPTNGTVSNGDMTRICAIRNSDLAKTQFGNNFDFQSH